MTDQNPEGPARKSNITIAADRLDTTGKVIRNLGIVAAFISYIWISFFGPGLQQWFQDYAGTTSVLEKVDFIEEHMAPPKVANWESNSVLGVCRPGDCFVRHFISRTSYGADCGVPIARAEIRVGGVISNLSLPGFSEVEATERGLRVDVPLGIDRFIPDGTHQYRFINVYPTCPWAREPIPRTSPWFDLPVAR